MVRSVRLLGVSVAAALLVSLVLIAPASAKSASRGGRDEHIITVPKGGDIQGAIDRAQPGDIVQLEAGKYRGAVHITTDRVSLVGAGAGETWIVPPSGGTPECGICVFGSVRHGVVQNWTSGVLIKGLTVEGFRDFGVVGFGSRSLSVRNVHAANNGEYGITAFTSQGAQYFSDVTWGNGEAGYYIGDSPNSKAKLWNNTAYDSQFGFFFRDASFGRAYMNTAWGNCAGFVLLNTGAPGPNKRWVVKNNTAHDNSKACSGGREAPAVSGIGIALAGTSHDKVVHNFITDNQSAGSHYIGSGIVVVSTKSDGGSNPIGNVVVNNLLRHNSPYDIWWDGSGKHNTFAGNRCSSASPGGLCY